MLGLNWNVSLPVGSVHDFTANVTPVGFQILGQYWVSSQIAIGAALDWQTFWDTRPRATYPIENGALTATADNSVQSGAARAVFRYYFQDEGRVLPYAGAHIGIGWQTFQSAAADLAFYDNTLSVLLGGELGVAIAASRSAPLFTVGARYTYLPTADFLSVTNVQSVDFLVGVLMQ
jgi:outer membrane protein